MTHIWAQIKTTYWPKPPPLPKANKWSLHRGFARRLAEFLMGKPYSNLSAHRLYEHLPLPTDPCTYTGGLDQQIFRPTGHTPALILHTSHNDPPKGWRLKALAQPLCSQPIPMHAQQNHNSSSAFWFIKSYLQAVLSNIWEAGLAQSGFSSLLHPTSSAALYIPWP